MSVMEVCTVAAGDWTTQDNMRCVAARRQCGQCGHSHSCQLSKKHEPPRLSGAEGHQSPGCWVTILVTITATTLNKEGRRGPLKARSDSNSA